MDDAAPDVGAKDNKDKDAKCGPRKQELWKPEPTFRPEPEMSPQLAYQLQQQRALKNQQQLLEQAQQQALSAQSQMERRRSRSGRRDRNDRRDRSARRDRHHRGSHSRRSRSNRQRCRSRKSPRQRRRSRSGRRKFREEAPQKKEKPAAEPSSALPNLGGRLIASRGEWAEYLKPCGEDRYYVNVVTKQVLEGQKPPGFDRVYQHSGFNGHMLQNMHYAKTAMITQDTPNPVTVIPGLATRPLLATMPSMPPGLMPALPAIGNMPLNMPPNMPANLGPMGKGAFSGVQ